MKNLSLQMASMGMLKKTADATNKSNAVVDKSAAVDSNNSFQKMLNRQVKNQKDSSQNSLVLQETAQKTPRLQNNSGTKVAGEKVEPKTDYLEIATNANVEGQFGVEKVSAKSSHDTTESKNSGLVEGLSAKPIEQVVLITKVLPVVEEDVDSKSEEVVNDTTEASTVALVVPFAQIIPTINSKKTYETSPAIDTKNFLQTSSIKDVALSNALAQSQSAQAKEGRASDAKVQKNNPQAVLTESSPEQLHWLEATQQSATKQTSARESISANLIPNTIKDGANQDRDMLAPLSYQATGQINATLPIQQTVANNNIIQAYPGKSGWDQAISQKVLWMIGASEQSATLTLNPPDLGPLQVVISVNNDMVDTVFKSDNAEVRQALQDGMTNLREKLNESGIQLGQANVSAGGQSKQEFQQATQNRLAPQLNSNTPGFVEEKTVIENTNVRLINGLVDTFA